MAELLCCSLACKWKHRSTVKHPIADRTGMVKILSGTLPPVNSYLLLISRLKKQKEETHPVRASVEASELERSQRCNF